MRKPTARRSPGLGAGLAALALAATGCAGTGATRIQPVAATQSASTTSAATFTACMRDNGLSDFPGLTIGSDSRVQLNLTGSDVDVFSTTYRKAVAACRHVPPSGTEVPGDPSPAAPSVPDLGFTSSGTCPKTPQAPPSPH